LSFHRSLASVIQILNHKIVLVCIRSYDQLPYSISVLNVFLKGKINWVFPNAAWKRISACIRWALYRIPILYRMQIMQCSYSYEIRVYWLRYWNIMQIVSHFLPLTFWKNSCSSRWSL
jgi:hypothetical protein